MKKGGTSIWLFGPLVMAVLALGLVPATGCTEDAPRSVFGEGDRAINRDGPGRGLGGGRSAGDPVAEGEGEGEGEGEEGEPVPLETTTLDAITDVLWDLAFDDDGNLYITGRAGTLWRLLPDGETVEVVAAVEDLRDFTTRGEGGLMGLALDPDFATNRFLYLCLTTSEAPPEPQGALQPQQIEARRYEVVAGGLREDRTLVAIPAGQAFNHFGCRLAFDDDDHLFISVGDAERSGEAPNPDDLRGKILRLHPDGRIPEDNPFGNEVWSLGHRNPQGLVFDGVTGRLYSTEHGPSDNDEVNLIQRGADYGWPDVGGFATRGGSIRALVAYTPTIAIAGMTLVRSPDGEAHLLVASLKAGQLHRLRLDPEDGTVVDDEVLNSSPLPRLRAVAIGPDGAAYLLARSTLHRFPLP